MPPTVPMIALEAIIDFVDLVIYIQNRTQTFLFCRAFNNSVMSFRL